MGRLLHPGNFGEVQTLFSIFAQISILLSVFGLLTINIVVNYDNAVRRNRVIVELERLGLILSAVLLAATVLGGAALQSFFRFGSSMPFVVLALAVVASVPLTFRLAYLRGRQRFGLVSLLSIVAAGGDLVLSVIFVLAGHGTTGAIAGLVAAQCIAFGFAMMCARRNGFSESLRGNLFRMPDFRFIMPELTYAGLVLIGSLGITGLYSIDTIAVKHYFDAHTAGLYAGISTIARIIYFLTASVVQVLMPAVRLQHTPLQNRQVLLKSFGLLAGIGGAALIVFSLLPGFIIRVLMGRTYLPYANLLPRLSLVIFTISILNLFVMYHMALRRYWVMLVVIAGVAVTLGLLGANHQSLRAVINSLLYGSVVMLALLGGWVGLAKYKSA
jgi:O-antigen/teichoic acid export membrane protein